MAKERRDIRVSPECHRRLMALAVRRSAEAGRPIGMTKIIEELLDLAEQLEQGNLSAEYFGAHD
jgi:hypothetical protein